MANTDQASALALAVRTSSRLRRLLSAHPMGVHVYAAERAGAELLVNLGEAEWLKTDANEQNKRSTGVLVPRPPKVDR